MGLYAAAAGNALSKQASTKLSNRPARREIEKEELRKASSSGVMDVKDNNKTNDNFARLLSTIGIPATLHTFVRTSVIQSRSATLFAKDKSGSQLTIEGQGLTIPPIEMKDIKSITAGRGSMLKSVKTLRDQRLLTILVAATGDNSSNEGTREYSLEVDGEEVRDAAVAGLQNMMNAKKKK
jgi:hypothetical protein